MNAFDITQEEKKNHALSPEKFIQAVQALSQDGFIVLNELIDPLLLAPIRDQMLADLAEILARKDTPFNFNRANIQQDPPPLHPYLHRDILVNDIVISLTKALLGPGLKNAFYSGNTALPETDARQPVHADMGQLWPNLEKATPPYALVVNVLPVDVSPANGSTEIWPGTHLDTSVVIQHGDIKVTQERLEVQRRRQPEFQYSAKAGSVVIRDMRLWHAGMPNPSSQPRPMIAMIHYVSWWTGFDPMDFPKGSEDIFQHPDLTSLVRFVDGPIDYLRRHQAFDLPK